MRALQTRHHHPLFRPGDLSEKSTRKLQRRKREGHGVPVFANPEANDHLDSWKEIASHLNRTVRTVQRWEKQERLPVHRHFHQRANSVYARKSEVDEWRCLERHRWGRTGAHRRLDATSTPKTAPNTIFAEGGAFVVHGEASSYVNVEAYVTLERVAGSESFDVSVVLQAGGQFIGKISLGTVDEGEQVLLSLRWDEPTHRFVVSSQRPGPIISYVALCRTTCGSRDMMARLLQLRGHLPCCSPRCVQRRKTATFGAGRPGVVPCRL
jgi:hypothetical protein